MQEKEVCRPQVGQLPFGKKVSRALSLGHLLALQQAQSSLSYLRSEHTNPHLPVRPGRG